MREDGILYQHKIRIINDTEGEYHPDEYNKIPNDNDDELKEKLSNNLKEIFKEIY